ncbi:unnamed protein product [Rhizopus stolonifer]
MSDNLEIEVSYQNLHNRSALLGETNSFEDHLESQNDEEITGLSAKVKLLKNITGKIGDEIRYGNGLLDNMAS